MSDLLNRYANMCESILNDSKFCGSRTTQETDMLQRQIALTRSLNKEEARSLFRHGHLPERLPQIADSVGLPVEVCRGVLPRIVWKFTEGLRPSKLNAAQ